MSLPADERTQFQVDRLAYFSDAIFAIAVTLLALNIHAPPIRDATEGELLDAIAHMVPSIIGFVLSFLVIGTYWRSHHRLFRYVGNYDDGFVTINLFLLLSVSFIPCPTAFYSEFPSFRTALIFYAASLLLVGVLNFALWRHVVRRPGLLRVDTPPFEIAVMGYRGLMIPLACALAIAFSFVNMWLARMMLLFIPVFMRIYTVLARRHR